MKYCIRYNIGSQGSYHYTEAESIEEAESNFKAYAKRQHFCAAVESCTALTTSPDLSFNLRGGRVNHINTNEYNTG